MSHMGILDMIGWLFVNFARWIDSTTQREAIANSQGARGSATPAAVSCGEDCEESHFDCQCFVNIAIQVIAQLFKTPDAFQYFGCAEPACQCSGFFSCTRQATLRHTVTGAQNVRPPGE